MVTPGWMKRLPPSASISPAAILRRVDLPEPLRPTSAILSPGVTDNSAPSSNRVEPRVRRMFWRVRTGAAGMLRGIDHADRVRSIVGPEREWIESVGEVSTTADEDHALVKCRQQIVGAHMPRGDEGRSD